MIDQRPHVTLSTPRSALSWLVVGYIGAFVATYLVFVRTGVGQRADNAGLAGRAVVPDRLVADSWDVLGTIGLVSLAVVAVAIIGFAAARGRPAAGLAAGVVILGSNLSTQALKHLVLERPDLTGSAVKAFNTFPSGHATIAMSVTLALVLVAPARWRAVVAGAAVLGAAVVGMATVTAGWHRPSDAIGAWLVTGAWHLLQRCWCLGQRGPAK